MTYLDAKCRQMSHLSQKLIHIYANEKLLKQLIYFKGFAKIMGVWNFSPK